MDLFCLGVIMKYTRLGRTGLWVSRICLGTANFGSGSSSGIHDWGVVSEKEAFRIMDFALEAGINFFDTSNVYGGLAHRGLTEEILGHWFKTGGRRRERTVLATKVGRPFEQDATDGPNNRLNYSIYKIRRHLETSLRRLHSDKIELYQMHYPDPDTNWDEVWEAFEGAIHSGTVDYIGTSNHSAWEIMKAQAAAGRRNLLGVVSEQHLYTPLNRLAEHELFPMALDQGVGVTLFSPLFRGTLGIDMLDLKKRPLTAESEYHLDRMGLRDTLTQYSALCHEIGETPANVTLAWELNHPAVTSVIVAPTSVKDLEELLRAVEITLDEGSLRRMDGLFPPLRELSPYPPRQA
jgi:aryl-alcohol dehydrogenase-like predicted oxidoreductase